MLKNELLKPTVTRPSHNYIHSEIFLPETNIHPELFLPEIVIFLPEIFIFVPRIFIF